MMSYTQSRTNRGKRQTAHDAKRCVGLEIHAVVLEEDDAVGSVRHAGGAKKILGGGSGERAEAELRGGIPGDDELNEAVAEIADAVEQDR